MKSHTDATSNPYTGCAAIFTSRIISNKLPHIFEDGNQTRDFIHARDIAQANLNALEHNKLPSHKHRNRKPNSNKSLAETLTKLYDKPNLQPYVSNEYRKGDVLHISFGKPQEADDSDITEEGVIIRLKEGKIIGLTILNASKRMPKK